MSNNFKTYLPWFVLKEIPYLGNKVYKILIDEFESPENVLNACEKKLIDIGIPSKLIKNIRKHKNYQDKAEKELELIFKKNIKILTLNDAFYPALLKDIYDPPPFLTYRGKLENKVPCIAIVGARQATSYGLNTALDLAYNLVQKGFQIVSGLARGIDSMAHKGALKAKGRTIAVIGSGLNVIYPYENKTLFEAIEQNGVIFSEFKVNAKPLPANFPIRNRIIAGLSCGSVIVEAAQKSGSLITARLSAEYNREVFAVPGHIRSKKSRGTHSLLKQGAKLVENEMDIIEELHHFVCLKTKEENILCHNQKSFDKSDNKIMNFLEPYPVHIDELIQKTQMDLSQITSKLLDLELKGIIDRHQGNYYSIAKG